MDTLQNGKFRTYIEKSGIWVYWGFGVEDQVFKGCPGFLDKNGPDEYAYLLKHTSQFTGLTDVHGREIYAGDILDFGPYSNPKLTPIRQCLHRVTYDIDSARFGTIELMDGRNEVYPFDGNAPVVGNIWQPIELVKLYGVEYAQFLILSK